MPIALVLESSGVLPLDWANLIARFSSRKSHLGPTHAICQENQGQRAGSEFRSLRSAGRGDGAQGRRDLLRRRARGPFRAPRRDAASAAGPGLLDLLAG